MEKALRMEKAMEKGMGMEKADIIHGNYLDIRQRYRHTLTTIVMNP